VAPRPVLKNTHSAPISPFENQLSFEYSVTGSLDLIWKISPDGPCRFSPTPGSAVRHLDARSLQHLRCADAGHLEEFR